MRFSLNLSAFSFAALLALALCTTDVMAQGGGRGGRGGDRGGRGGGDSPARLLSSESVQKDLELTEEQLESIKELGENRGRGDREAMRAEMEGLSQEERMEKFQEMMKTRNEESLKSLGEILLPQQMERLAQISAQASARGGARSLVSGTLAEKLNITDEQKEALQAKAEELQKSLDAKIEKLRSQMQDELLAELTPEQQSQFKELMGEKFTFEQRQRGGQGGRGGAGGDRGGRGGAGGDRGGRGGNRGGRGGDRGGRGGDQGGDAEEPA